MSGLAPLVFFLVPKLRFKKSFARGDAPEGLNWKWEILNQVLWKMLAEPTGHTIRVVLEHEFEELLSKDAYKEIGGDSDDGVSFEEYLREKNKA
jgi:hypothetical protein